ncbi:MAG: hypothetical protein GXP26_14265 [Planctomycetes bacterium]|nr:hypothetical protein [Planctomycetota bacterium]
MTATDATVLAQLQHAWGQPPAEIPTGALPAIVTVGNEPKGPPHCPKHNNLDNWQDEPQRDQRDWIRSTCQHCGRFVGYRPEESDKKQ